LLKNGGIRYDTRVCDVPRRQPVSGYDYAYYWGDNWGTKGNNWDEYFSYIESTLTNALKGYNLHYYLRTYKVGDEGEYRAWTSY
jgi:hypothetical protein